MHLARIAILTTLLSLTTVVAPQRVAGQASPDAALDPRLAVGTRVRVLSAVGRRDPAVVTGTLVSARADSLMVERSPGAQPTAVPLAQARAVWVSRGMKQGSFWRGALKGALVVGVVLGVVSVASNECDLFCFTAPEAFAFGFGFGALGGGLIGGLVGSATRNESWERVR